MWNEGGIIFGVTVLEDKDPTGGYLQCSLNANLTMSPEFPLHSLHTFLYYIPLFSSLHLLLAKKKKKKKNNCLSQPIFSEDSAHQLPPSKTCYSLHLLIPSLFWKLQNKCFPFNFIRDTYLFPTTHSLANNSVWQSSTSLSQHIFKQILI